MLKVNIDGKDVEARKGEMILNLAERTGIEIPTLCNHEAVSPYGVCRLCVVEVIKQGRSRIVASCLYPILDENLEIKTKTEKIIKIRKTIIELLLARCPEVKILQKLAEEYQVDKVKFNKEDKDCILCGLCVRVCSEIVKRNALGFINRGAKREVGTPYFEQSDTCIGCGSCAYVCPTECIRIEDKEGKRFLKKWNTELELNKCKTCGNYFAPDFQLEYIRDFAKLPKEFFEVCLNCRK